MSVLRTRPTDLDFTIVDPEERARRIVGIRICVFANGSCECANRRHICERVEVQAAAILDALRTVGAGL